MKLTEEQLKLVEENQKLISYVINKLLYCKRLDPNDYEDIFSEGRYWLCKAASVFDANNYTKFSPLAVEYIKCGILKYLNRNCGMLYSRKIEDIRRNIKNIQKSTPQLTDIEIFEMLGEHDLNLYYALKPVKSLNDIKYQGNDNCKITISDELVDDSVDVESEAIDKVSLLPIILKCLDEITLSKIPSVNNTRKCLIKDHLLGVYSGNEMTQAQLGSKYGISRQVVSNVLIEGLGKLRIKLKSEGITLDM